MSLISSRYSSNLCSLSLVYKLHAGGYGFLDSHKKNMIRKWVENQTMQVQQKKVSGVGQSSSSSSGSGSGKYDHLPTI